MCQQTSMDYQAYQARRGHEYPARRELTEQEFRAWQARWDAEYDGAWAQEPPNFSVIRELEYYLCA